MVANLKDELDRTKRYVRKHFSSALMSDTKWRKLFAALDESDIGIEQAVVKFVETAERHVIQMPKTGHLHPPIPFIDTIEFGVVELCAIEWLEIPKAAAKPRHDGLPPSTVMQDIDAACAIITKLGKFPIEESDGGLRILGYAR